MMKRLVYLLPLAVLAVLAVYFALGLKDDPRRLPTVLLNKPLPEFALKPIEGRTHGLSNADLMGHVSLLNVYGSWCFACAEEHPFLLSVKKRNLVPIYGIDWRETDRTSGPKWLERHGDPYTLVGDDPDSEAVINLGVAGAPETFVVDSKGIIRYKQIGPITPENWKSTLWPLIQHLRTKDKAS